MKVLICFGFSNNLKTTSFFQIIQPTVINNRFSVISSGLITMRGRGLPITPPPRNTSRISSSIVNPLPHVHTSRSYFTAFPASETRKSPSTQHTNLPRQCFTLKSVKSAEFIPTQYQNEFRGFRIWRMFSDSRKPVLALVNSLTFFWQLYKMNYKIN